MWRRRRSCGAVFRCLEQRPEHERAGREQEECRYEQGHDAPTGLGICDVTGTKAVRRAPALPRTTPRMMIAPPTQLQLTSGWTKTRNEAEPSPGVPDSTT